MLQLVLLLQISTTILKLQMPEPFLTVFTLRSYLTKHPMTPTRQHPLTISVEILEDENIEHAKTAGADEIVASTRIGYSMLSHSVAQRGSAKILNSILSAKSQNLYVTTSIKGYHLPKPFILVQQELKQQFGILVIGIHNDQQDQINPSNDTTVQPNDGIVYLAAERINAPYTHPPTNQKDDSPNTSS